MYIQSINSTNNVLSNIGLTSTKHTSQQSNTDSKTVSASTQSAVTDMVSLTSNLANMENEALLNAEPSMFG